MKHWLGSLLAAASLLTASAALAAFHLFSIEQIFSNADGTIQFIVLTCPPASCMNFENAWAGQATITSTHAGTTQTFTASSNLLSSATVGKKVLVATPGFAALGLVAPDYTIPNGFLPTDAGTIAYVSSSVTYKAGELPTDGTNALYVDGSVRANLATNFAGASASVTASTGGIGVIGPGFTGAWFDPAQSGHGIFLEVLPPNNLLAWWFTFTPDGTQQAWFGGVGNISGNTASVPVLLYTGGQWIPNFDPTKIVKNPWGTLNFTFTDCNSGRVDFISTYPGYGSNHMILTRLTQPAGLTCP